MITINDLAIPPGFALYHQLFLIFELFLILAGLFVTLISGYIIFIQHPQFHPHLMIIVSSFYLAYFMVSIPRALIISMYFYNGSQGFETSINDPLSVQLDAIRTGSASAALLAAPLLVAERIVATKYITTYESQRNVIQLLVIVALLWIVAIYSSHRVAIEDWDLFTFILLGFLCIFPSAILFRKLCKWSENEYNCNGGKYPLSVRFQLSENVRFGRVLMSTLKTFASGSVAGLILVVLVKQKPMLSYPPTAILIMYHIYELMIASLTTTVMLVALTSDETWKRSLLKIINTVSYCRRKKIEGVPAVRVLSLSGSVLTIDQRQEANTYFNTFQHMWK